MVSLRAHPLLAQAFIGRNAISELGCLKINNNSKLVWPRATYRERSALVFKLYSSTSNHRENVSKENLITNNNKKGNSKRLAIIGGGLAGLSTAYHYLSKIQGTSSSCHVTIYDIAPVGTGGASSVAGGFLHPLSPSGKLVHWGLEGVQSTNRLIEAAVGANVYDNIDHNNIILRNEIHRLVLQQSETKKTLDQIETMKKFAKDYPTYAKWIETDQFPKSIRDEKSLSSSLSTPILGGLRLSNGCKVLHVPSYLKGLFHACQSLCSNSQTFVEWCSIHNLDAENDSSSVWIADLQMYDIVVFAAGSGMFQRKLTDPSSPTSVPIMDKSMLPIQLVRGQSILVPTNDNIKSEDFPAFLGGKYISPMPSSNTIMIGATHEFRLDDPMSKEQVVDELQQRTYGMAPAIWESASDDNIEVLNGIRVQSNRGKFGRLPIIGKLDEGTVQHPNAWIFTGLSSRGLLYHSLYGDILTDAILSDSEDSIRLRSEDLMWWKRHVEEKSNQKAKK